MFGIVSHIRPTIYQNVCIKVVKQVFYFLYCSIFSVTLLAEMNYRIKQQLNKSQTYFFWVDRACISLR